MIQLNLYFMIYIIYIYICMIVWIEVVLWCGGGQVRDKSRGDEGMHGHVGRRPAVLGYVRHSRNKAPLPPELWRPSMDACALTLWDHQSNTTPSPPPPPPQPFFHFRQWNGMHACMHAFMHCWASYQTNCLFLCCHLLVL